MTHRLISRSITEVARLYESGELTRDDTLEILVQWEYEGNPADTSEDRDEDGVPYPGTFAEVEEAFYQGLIDSDLYDELVDAVSL